jgi:hypothetical protein
MFCLFLSLFDANTQSTTNEPLTHVFQGKGGYIVPIKMLKRSPKAGDGHGDSVLLSKHAGSSSFQVKTFVNAIAGKDLYAFLMLLIYYLVVFDKFYSFFFGKELFLISIIIARHLKDSYIM